jgi:DNA-binding NarL/FixJ family response regulator
MNFEHEIRIIISDDHFFVVNAFKELLENYEGIKVVGTANSPQRAALKAVEIKPDVIMFDLDYGHRGNIEDSVIAIRQIRAGSPNTRILAVTAYDSLMEHATLADADKVVHKNDLFSKEELIDCILDTYNARTLEEPSIIPYKPLSKREQEVLNEMVIGKSDRQIAEVLSIAISTVKHHNQNIFSKLGVANRKEAIFHAAKYNLAKKNNDDETSD